MLLLLAKPNAERNVKDMREIWAMGAASINSLRHPASQKRVRRRSITFIVPLSALLAVSILTLPAPSVFAEQVLEVPQTAASTPLRDAPIDAEPEPEPQHRALAPMPSGLGSIQDYENQDESDRPVGFSNNPSNVRIDQFGSSGNRSALANNVLLGALAIGLFAMELHAAHRHHH